MMRGHILKFINWFKTFSLKKLTVNVNRNHKQKFICKGSFPLIPMLHQPNLFRAVTVKTINHRKCWLSIPEMKEMRSCIAMFKHCNSLEVSLTWRNIVFIVILLSDLPMACPIPACILGIFSLIDAVIFKGFSTSCGVFWKFFVTKPKCCLLSEEHADHTFSGSDADVLYFCLVSAMKTLSY